MVKQYKIYLDVCCFSRPFDDWGQSHVRLEAEAVLEIIDRCQIGDWLMVVSTAQKSEVEQTPEVTKRDRIRNLLGAAKIEMNVTEENINRAVALQGLGFKPFDALHIACAEAAEVDAFITTDDRLLRKAVTYSEQLDVRVVNPIAWIVEIDTITEGENYDDPS